MFPSASSQPKTSPRTIASHKLDSDLDDNNKNTVQSILRKSRQSITCALMKAQDATTAAVEIEKKNIKNPVPSGSGTVSGTESKRGSMMSVQSNSTCSTDISRVCSKEIYEDWLVSDELLDILSGTYVRAPSVSFFTKHHKNICVITSKVQQKYLEILRISKRKKIFLLQIFLS